MMMFACALSDCVIKAYRWLCVEPCCTSAVLLSMSFGINSVFTGLAFSKYNLFVWMKRKALWCVQRSSNASFLAKIEQSCRVDAGLRRQYAEYQDTVEKFRLAMTSGSAWWEWMRRSVSMLCAMAAFVFVAFECKTRMGVCLVLPYVIMLVIQLAIVFVVSCRVWCRFRRLVKSADFKSGRVNRPSQQTKQEPTEVQHEH